MAAPPQGSVGTIEPVAPPGALAQELAEVANSAGEVRRALAGANIPLPDHFPRADLDAVAGTLELTPGMSADGALGALTYARPKLSQLRRRWVAIEDSRGELPDVQRGGPIDQAIARLIADVDTAREWYYEARKAAAERSDVPEDVLAPAGSGDDLSALSARAHASADKAGAIADELAEGATPGSVAADNLVRGVRDVEVLSRQEGIELGAPRPRLNLLDRLGRAVDRSATFVRGALHVVEAVADFANITWQRCSNIVDRQVSVILEEVRDGARELRQRIAHYQREWKKENATAPHPGPLPGGEGGSAPHPSPLPQAGEGEKGGAAPPSPAARERAGVRVFKDFEIFRDIDAPWCPEMVVIRAGKFLMGSPPGEVEAYGAERPEHWVTIGTRFAIGRTPVTVGEYRKFVEVTHHRHEGGMRVWTGSAWKQDASKSWQDPGFAQTDRHPVVGVSWRDAVAYCEWLAKETGQPYRLPSESEWEYACRAGTTTRYAWGDAITPKNANYAESKPGRTTEVGAYPPNPWGLYDMHGNVWEWVEDVWHDSYKGAPTDGSAWTEGEGKNSSRNRVLRGGSWSYFPWNLRSALRNWNVPDLRDYIQGFRVARTLS